jgi:hypothetical protein
MNSDPVPGAGLVAPSLGTQGYGETWTPGLVAPPPVAGTPPSTQTPSVPGDGTPRDPGFAPQPEPPPANLVVVANAFAHSDEHYIQFITQAYQTYLGRQPEAAGLNAWLAAMKHGLSDEQLEAGFIGSTEYINKHGGPGAGWVIGMYQDLLGRTPAQTEVDGWLYALGHGVSPRQVAYGFAASAEREAIRVNNDYMTYLGRQASQAEVQGWVYAFEHGASNEDVVAGFVGSAEYYGSPQKGQGDRTDWIVSVYTDVLGRTPSNDEIEAWCKCCNKSPRRGSEMGAGDKRLLPPLNPRRPPVPGRG